MVLENPQLGVKNVAFLTPNTLKTQKNAETVHCLGDEYSGEIKFDYSGLFV